jgi:hypothetical protein
MTLKPSENPFADFSRGEMYAFIHKKYGEEGLRQIFEHPLRNERTKRSTVPETRELDEDAAQEFRIIGLNHVADIVGEYAAKLPSQYDAKPPSFAQGPGYDANVRDCKVRREKQINEDKRKYPWRTGLKKFARAVSPTNSGQVGTGRIGFILLWFRPISNFLQIGSRLEMGFLGWAAREPRSQESQSEPAISIQESAENSHLMEHRPMGASSRLSLWL